MNKKELIEQYRKLGKDMTELRDKHIIEKEACIAKYKNAKAAIQAERAKLLEKILTNFKHIKAKTEVTETVAA